MVAPASRAIRAAGPKGTRTLYPSARLPEGCEYHPDDRAASFFKSAVDFGGWRLAESLYDSGVCGLRHKARSGLEGSGLSLEHFQRTGHLRIADISARRVSAVSQMAFSLLPESYQAHGRGAWSSEPRNPAEHIFPRAGSRHREELDFVRRVPEFRSLGSFARGSFAPRLQSFRAGRISGRPTARGFHVSWRQLLWPRAVKPFSGAGPDQRRFAQTTEATGHRLRRHVRAASDGLRKTSEKISPAIRPADLHHRTRRGVN